MAVAKTASTNAKFFILSGTAQEVVNALDAEGVPATMICGFTGGTTCYVIYKRN